MVQIRSTQTKATSNKHGLCDIVRVMHNIDKNKDKDTMTLIIEDIYIKEQTITIDDVEITERLIVEVKPTEAFTYPMSLISEWFSVAGTDILTSGDYAEQCEVNEYAIFVAQSSTAGFDGGGWQTMDNWIKDEWVEDETHVTVKQFTVV